MFIRNINVKYSYAFCYYSIRSSSFISENSVLRNDLCENRKVPFNFSCIPGPKNYPIIGTLYKYFPIIGDYDAEALHKNAWLNWCRYGSLVREVPLVNVLHVFEPDAIEAVFRKDDRYPARRSHIAMQHYRLNKPEIYNTGGLLSTNGPDWWRLRSLFQKKISNLQAVKSYVPTTDTILQDFLEWIKKMKIYDFEDFLPYLNRLNLEIIGMVAFNERFNSFSPEEQNGESRSSKIIDAAFGSNSGIMKLDKDFVWKIFKTPLYRKLEKSQQYLENVSMKILLDRVHFFEHQKTEHDKSLLTHFLQQSALDLKDITGMMVDILMASIDTTAYSTSFALYHIARNPETQMKLFQEIFTLLPNKNYELNAEILSKAIYLKSCVKESLRLNPVAVGVGRLLQKSIVLKGYLVPKGTVVVTQNMMASRLPQYIRDPLRFKPERWIRNTCDYENIHPFLSLPFGFGPRACIARRLAEQNICITLMRLIREFELKWRGEELGVRTLLINKPDKGVTLSFVPRSK